MIRRPPRSTLDRSSAASDVYKRQVHLLEDAVHVGLRLAHRQPADAVAVPVTHRAHGVRRLAAEGGVDATLHDREERLLTAPGDRILAHEPLELGATADEPAQAPLARVARGTLLALPGDDVIELHDDVGAEVPLDAH